MNVTSKKIFVELTLGHQATLREKKTAEGYTHDWEVYVRSEQGPIQAFVEKVIFHLHESFPKPRRVVREPPFSIKESGYAGFIIQIEVIFKNKDDPKRAEFTYDLFLHSTGPPVVHQRKEKLIFNFPSEEFSRKLFKGGAVIHKEKESSRDHGDRDTNLTSSTSHIQTNSGGKSSKHSSTNPKSSPKKDSFHNIFGTPIKRIAPSLTTTSLSGSTSHPHSGPSKDSKPGKSGGKGGDKSEKIFGSPNTTTGSKGEKGLGKGSFEKSKASKSPMLGSPASSSDSSSSKPSSSKSSGEKDRRNKSDEKNRMLPPEHSAVPKKIKKSEIFEPSPSSSTSSKSSSEKSKKTSKHVKKKHNDFDSNPSTPEVAMKKEVEEIIKKDNMEPLSPISSSSHSSSSPSVSSRSEAHSEDEQSDGGDSECEEINGKSHKRIVAANSTSSSSRRRSRRSDSESGTDESNVGSASPGSSSGSSSAGSPSAAKRRKTSTSSSSLTPDHTSSTTSTPRMEKPNSSSSVKSNQDRHEKKDKKSKKSRKKSKKHPKDAEKVFGDILHSSEDDSDGSSEVDSYLSPGVNGITSNSLSPSPAFTHTNNNLGTLSPEMTILQNLYTRISSLEDSEKLQEIVDIVESCGRDSWTIETGISFDFDLCKLSSATIKRIQDAIFD